MWKNSTIRGFWRLSQDAGSLTTMPKNGSMSATAIVERETAETAIAATGSLEDNVATVQ